MGIRLLVLVCAACWAGVALCNPTGPVVVSGQAAVQQFGNLLQITNSPSAIINWNRFSIAAGEITRFLQQSATSSVLNRVVGQDPSAILGTLQSNGRVFLINPNGILFGAGAQVDVAGLVASTLSLSDGDFLAGKMKFAAAPGAGTVTNNGNITTSAGGNVYLVGSSVTNGGIVNSPQGEVLLVAGSAVELVNPSTPQLRVEVAANGGETINLGQILATSGSIGIYAGLIRSTGTIRADKAVGLPDGRIVLAASQSLVLEGSLIASSGTIMAPDATISVQTDGNINVVAGVVHLEADSISVIGGQLQGQGGIVPGGAQIQVQGGSVSVAGGQIQLQGAGITVTGGNVAVQGGTLTVEGQGSGTGNNDQNSAGSASNIPAPVSEFAKADNALDTFRRFLADHASNEIARGMARATSLFSTDSIGEHSYRARSTLIVDIPRRSGVRR